MQNFKRCIFVIFLIFCLHINIFSLDCEYNFNLGVFGAGLSSYTGIKDGYFYGKFIYFTMQIENSFGFTVSPLVLLTGIREQNYLFAKFIDLSLFYDFVKNKSIIFGPFSSLGALSNLKVDYFEINSGLLLSISNTDNGIFLNPAWLNIEIGYTYNNIVRKNGFYGRIGINLIAALFYLGLGQEKKAAEYQSQNQMFLLRALLQERFYE
jgi:hypothetical protein